MSANGTDALFDIIQKELQKIVERGEHVQVTSESVKNVSKEKQESKVEKSTKKASTPRIAGGVEGRVHDSGILSLKPSDVDEKLDEMTKKYKTTLEKEIEAQTAALDSPRAKSIDADLQKMQLELQDSYNAFQTISQKFEAIDFSCLQKRIKDLNLVTKREVVGIERSNELRKAVDEGFQNNRLDLTPKLDEKFRKRGGEFGNIPELSSFFQACTQLEHCLGNLKRQRNDVRDLESRMHQETEISINRTNHIKQQLAEDNFEDNFEL